MNRLSLLLLAISGFIVTGCATTTNLPDDYKQKYQDKFEEDHIDLIWRSDRQHDSFVKKGLIQQNKPLNNYLNAIAKPFIERTEQSLDIKVFIFRNPQVNAFAMPNGHVYFNEGLIASLDNKDQLAFVVGHEIAHVELEHSIKRRRSTTNTLATTHIADIMLTGVGLGGLAYGGGALSILSHSREAERESDLRSIELMCNSGFSAQEASKALDKLANNKRNDRLKGSIWGSHPGIGERIELVKEHSLKQDCSMVGTPSQVNYETHVLPIVVSNVVEMKLRRRQYQAAIEYATDVLKTHPNTPEYHYLTAEGYRLFITDPEGAAREMTAYTGEGTVESNKQEILKLKETHLSNAKQNYAAALALNANFANPYKGLGILEKELGNNEEAKTHFKRYLELEEDTYKKAYVKSLLTNL